MNVYKESFRKQDLKLRLKRRPGEDFFEQCQQSPLQRKYEWFKKRYSKNV
jgi:hypothetical protein